MGISVYRVLLELLIFVVTGYAFRRLKIFTSDMSEKLSELLLKLVLPFSLISSSQQHFVKSSISGVLLSIVLSLLYYLLSFAVLKCLLPRFCKRTDVTPIIYDLCIFSNTGFLGFAITPLLFKETGTLFAISHNFVFQLLYFTIGMGLVENPSRPFRDLLKPRTLVSNRIILISVLSMVLYVLPFRFPGIITVSLKAFGYMMTPLSLFIVGLQTGSLSFKALFREKGVIPLSLVRMLFVPGVFFIVLLLLPLDSEIKGVAFILYAMPSASLNAVIAERSGRRPVLASSVVAVTTLLYFLLLPLDTALISYL